MISDSARLDAEEQYASGAKIETKDDISRISVDFVEKRLYTPVVLNRCVVVRWR